MKKLGYSCQANQKMREGASHPDRHAQFRNINATVTAATERGEPAISVDTKKKELVGDFKNAGRELRPQGDPEPVRVHDFQMRRGHAVLWRAGPLIRSMPPGRLSAPPWQQGMTALDPTATPPEPPIALGGSRTPEPAPARHEAGHYAPRAHPRCRRP